MKKYGYIVSMVVLSCSVNVVQATPRGWVRKNVIEHPYQSSIQAQLIAPLLFAPNNDGARARYIKHATFYAKKNDRNWTTDPVIDHAVFPVIDAVVGAGMTHVGHATGIDTLTDSLSCRNKKFVADEVQLFASAAVVKAIRIHSETGIQSVTRTDCINSAKSCAAQVGCDAVSEYIITPLVRNVAHDGTVTSGVLKWVLNNVMANYVINTVDSMGK